MKKIITLFSIASIALIIFSNPCNRCFAQFNLLWQQTSNPGGGSDRVYAITADASGIYVAEGGSFGSGTWNVEKRNLSTGTIIWTQTFSGSSDVPYAITADASGVYVAGSDYVPAVFNEQWRVEKRNVSTGVVIWQQGFNFSSSADRASAIAVDATGVYIAGFDMSTSNNTAKWRIQKRDLNTGVVIWSQGMDLLALSDDWINAIAVDATGVYAVGRGGIGGQNNLQKLDLSTGNPIWAQTSSCMQSITADASGVYVVDGDGAGWRIEKRDLTTGALIATFGTGGVVNSNPSTGIDQAFAVTADASGIYVGGIEHVSSNNNFQWRIEKRDLNTGALLCTYTNNPSVTDWWEDKIYSVTVDATGLYAAGSDNSPGNGQLRIEKYNGCGTLPISLLTFTARWLDVSQTDALLEWSTASETNNSHFEIQRMDATAAGGHPQGENMEEWKVMGNVPGAGNSSSVLNYQYIDNTLPEPTKADVFYYRLKQTDYDGQFSYSNIEVLTRGSITVIGPAPNPIIDELNFSLLSASDGEVRVVIINALGQLVKNEQRVIYKGIQQIKVPLHALSAGSYLLHVTTSDGAERISKEFIIN